MARYPTHSQRTVVLGRTGTGKTTAGLWHLSGENFAAFPWIIWDTKGDKIIRKIAKMTGVGKLTFNDPVPRKGLHVIRPLPHEMKSDACNKFLWSIHKRENCGMFIDEGYMFDKYSDALTALYTQGRSKHIPIITLSQKPKYLNQFTFSEADFFQVYALNDKKDRQRVNEFMPGDLEKRLPPFHSLWYDVGQDLVTEFQPVPDENQIVENFGAQLRRINRVI